MAKPRSPLGCRPLPRWTPVDLAAALGPRRVALLDGLQIAGRHCTLVAWEPVAQADTLPAAVALPDGRQPLPAMAPALLGAAVGALAFDGGCSFWLPGAAALFDWQQQTLWYRGELPETVVPSCPPPSDDAATRLTASPGWERARFIAAVETARRRIRQGDLKKVVLAVPFTVPGRTAPLAIYRRLTDRRPPGLSFLLSDADGGALVGASPEPLVTLTGRRVELHPLAGTRPAADNSAPQLLTSSKDRDEHTLAVEQAYRDLLSICTPESVTVEAFMTPESHPGLVHLASHIVGTAPASVATADVISACFPAGTVSGVPRTAALQLIRTLEPHPRGWYAGAVGALLPGGDVQLWLTIRSVAIAGDRALVQTGAGIVAASDAAAEWQECLCKARPTLAALGAEVAHAANV